MDAEARHSHDPDDTVWSQRTLIRVSRTFALCIRFLPGDIQDPVLLSYLLCRIADTIEDHPELPVGCKRALLAHWATLLTEPAGDAQPIENALPTAAGADEELVREAGRVLRAFARQPATVRAVISPWVQEMCRGMAEYAPQRIRAVGQDARELSVLATERDLDVYCYFVAGTVGHLLTGLFGRLRPESMVGCVDRLDGLAESFGAGLQLTNIIVDAPVDQQRGVSYVPEELCLSHGFASSALLQPAQQMRARAVMGHLVRKARQHLADAVAYCELLPKTEPQIRMFCLVPVFLALRTLREVEFAPSFPVAGRRLKIGRAAVYRTVAAARLCASSNHLVRAYAHHLEF